MWRSSGYRPAIRPPPSSRPYRISGCGKRVSISYRPRISIVPDEELPNMGNVAAGLVTSGTYSSAADRPANKAFVAAWNKEYGGRAIPDFLSAHGWDGMNMIFELIKQTKGRFTGDQAIKFFTNW